jgi:hypothetical protein
MEFILSQIRHLKIISNLHEIKKLVNGNIYDYKTN